MATKKVIKKKPSTSKKTTKKKSVQKKAVNPKAAKKTVAKKASPRKTTKKKSPAKKVTKKASVKKTTIKKTNKKTPAKKVVTKKSIPKNQVKRKTTISKSSTSKSSIKDVVIEISKQSLPTDQTLKKTIPDVDPIPKQKKTKEDASVVSRIFTYDNVPTLLISTFASLLLIVLTTILIVFLGQEEASTPKESPLLSASLETTTSTKTIGESITVGVYVKPASLSSITVDEVQLHLRFDPTEIYIEEVSEGSPLGTYKSIMSNSAIDNQNGRVYIDWTAKDENSGFKTDVQIATITLKPKIVGEVKLTISETSDSNTKDELASQAMLSNGKSALIGAVNLDISVEDNNEFQLIENTDLSDICSPQCDTSEICSRGECLMIEPIDGDEFVKIEYPSAPTTSMKYCINDYDCVRTSTTCCECSQGGDEIAINEQYLSKYKSSLGCQNDTYACLDVYQCSDVQPKCISNTCVLDGNLSSPTIDEYTSYQFEQSDLNRDGKTTVHDYAIFSEDFQLCLDKNLCDSRSDFNADGSINDLDYTLFVDYYNISQS